MLPNQVFVILLVKFMQSVASFQFDDEETSSYSPVYKPLYQVRTGLHWRSLLEKLLAVSWGDCACL
jgi:hypothetical protein